MKTWFITGASRGFGLEIARLVLSNGDAVVATARDPMRVTAALPNGGDQLLAVGLDVTDAAQAQAAVDLAVARFGAIDVLINNAGHGIVGAVEETSDAEARAVFDVNVFGLLTVTRAVLPVMRQQRSGTVANISSVGGFVVGSGFGVYGGTKFAVEGISEALCAELAPLGIHVTIIEPGRFRTDFLDPSSLMHAASELADYAGTAGAVRAGAAEQNHAQLGDPALAAAAIITAITSVKPPTRLQLGSDCVARVEQKLAHVADELDHWRGLALSTDLTVTLDAEAAECIT